MPAINYKDIKKNSLPQVGGFGSTPNTSGSGATPMIGATAGTTGVDKLKSPWSGTGGTGSTSWFGGTTPQPNTGGSTGMLNAWQSAAAEQNAKVAKARAPIKPVAIAPAVDTQVSTLPPVKETTAPVAPKAPGYETTDLGTQALDQYSKYALGDEDPQVTAERERLERNKVLTSEQTKRDAHSRAVQAGYRPGSPQYEQMMRGAITQASNASIQAENAFNDFARGRRSDRQGELENVLSGEFSRVGQQQGRDITGFNQLAKFLPSDKAQQMLAVASAKGMDIGTSMANMYDAGGSLKSEYQDLSQPELIKKGIEQSVGQLTTNPDTGAAWAGNEQQAYVDKFYADNFQNILYPSQVQSEQVTEQEAAKGRVETGIESGDFSTLTQGDWNTITDSQIVDAKSKGLIVDYDKAAQIGDNWSDLDNMNTSDATSRWLVRNPISAPENKGKIIDVDGVIYEITDPMKVVNLGGDNKRISIMAKPVKGGPEKSIKNSSRFEGTTSSFFKGLF